MTKHKKSILIFSIILLQTIAASAAGFAINYALSHNTLPAGTEVSSVDLSGLDMSQAAEMLENKHGNGLGTREVSIRIDEKLYTFEYGDIEGRLDVGATVRLLFDRNHRTSVARIFSNAPAISEGIKPVISFNEGKLRRLLEEIADDIQVEPKDASVTLQVGLIDKKPGSSGTALDIEQTVKILRGGMDGSNGQVFVLDASSGALRSIAPSVLLQDLKEIEDVISVFTVKAGSGKWDSDILAAVEAIDGSFIKAKGNNRTSESSFSFIDCLDKAGVLKPDANNGFDMAASALYAALLKLPLADGAFSRTPHENTVDYIDAGLDAAVLEGKYDLKFNNTMDNPIAVMAEYRDGSINVTLAGSLSDSGMASSLSTEIVQKIEPGIVTLENRDMKKGEINVLMQGREGAVVNVYRVNQGISGEEMKVLLYHDTYKPVNIIREAGPGTEFHDGYNK